MCSVNHTKSCRILSIGVFLGKTSVNKDRGKEDNELNLSEVMSHWKVY